jgi:aldose 1-epimerase
VRFAFVLLVSALAARAQQYSAVSTPQDGVDVVTLSDRAHSIEVKVVPSLGNRAVQFNTHGHNILYAPISSLAGAKSHPGLNGIPFLAPWANRLDGPAFWANGNHYRLNPEIKSYGTDGNGLPIHGSLSQSDHWRVVSLAAGANDAHVTSRLEFWRYPELMEQWPFAQDYEMTYTLSGGTLEVKTTITNRSVEPMPVSIGFHPYYRIPDAPRDTWTLESPARKAVAVNNQLVPIGEFPPAQLPNPIPMKGRNLDDGFTDLQRDSAGRASFFLRAGSKSIQIAFGPKFPVAILWEPPVRGGAANEFVCVEPMAGVTNAINLNHAGKYPDLQMIGPEQTWTESFWITPSGFE